MIGHYETEMAFTNANAGTSEWCIAHRDGKEYFIKKFNKPVYPSRELGLAEEKSAARARRFNETMRQYETMYAALRGSNHSGLLVVPDEVLSYQFHICTAAEKISANVKPSEVQRLSEWQRLVLMRSLTLALMDVHEAGVIHGDMKPDNILIVQNAQSGDCQLRLIDFDSSYWASSPPETADDIVGDMAYWAPEIFAKFGDESIALDKTVDVFALGLILHVLWTGALPQKPADQTVGECVLNGHAVGLDPSLPLVLNRLISGMIRKDPAQRISCQDVYRILGIQLEQFPRKNVILAKKPSQAQMTIRLCDNQGNTIQSIPMKLEPGTTVTVKAKELEGYRLTGADKVEVSVDNEGVPSRETVDFIYGKKSMKWLGFLIAALAFVLLVVLCGLNS